VITLVYINDGLFLGADKTLVDSKKCACLEHWECCDTGDVTDFLGMKVNKTASCITIDQKAYLKTVLERFDMHNAKITPTPILPGYVPQENKGTVDPVQHQKFQSVIRSSLYLMLGTHPDIAFMVIKCHNSWLIPAKTISKNPCTSCTTSSVHKITTWSTMVSEMKDSLHIQIQTGPATLSNINPPLGSS